MSKGNNDNEPKCRMRSINSIGRDGVQAVHICACMDTLIAIYDSRT